jgi:polyisoprenoid-binding protein YceI
LARYQISPHRSKVVINARSSLHPIHSETDGLEGWIDLEVLGGGRLNLTVAPKAQLTLPVEQLQSGSPLEDRELKRRIDARRFPTIDGELTEMKETGRDGRYLVSGELTFRGTTRHHEDEMTVEQVDDSTIKLEGTSTFDIRDFGMQPPRILMLKVEPDVTVTVEIVAEKEA